MILNPFYDKLYYFSNPLCINSPIVWSIIEEFVPIIIDSLKTIK